MSAEDAATMLSYDVLNLSKEKKKEIHNETLIPVSEQYIEQWENRNICRSTHDTYVINN